MAFVEENTLDNGGKSYTIRWRDTNGMFERKTLRNKREAERFALRVENELADGNSTDALVKNAKRFREVAQASMDASSHKIKPKTLAGYELAYRLQIYPTFGDKRISQITSLDVEAWLSDMQSKIAPKTGQHYSLASVHGAFVALSKAFAYAVKHRLITANPCSVVDKPRLPHVERRLFHPAEVDAIATAMDAAAPHGLRMASTTGLRQGELAALRIGDVRLFGRAPHVQVRRTVARVKGGWAVGTPKTARGSRDAPLGRSLIGELSAYLSQHPRRNEPDAPLWPGRMPGGAGDIRALDYDRQFDAPSMERYYFKPVLAELGIEGMTWHDLRHYFASLCAAAGYDIRKVSRRMGHANTNITDSTYTHLFHDGDDMDALDAAALRARDLVEPVRPIRATGGDSR
jgi:integrase